MLLEKEFEIVDHQEHSPTSVDRFHVKVE